MKREHWLGASIVLNVAAIGLLIGMVVRGPKQPAAAPINDPPGMPETAAARAAAPASGKSAGPAAVPALADNNWVRILRSAGVPERLVASVASADFEERWQAKMRELQMKYDRGEIEEEAFSEYLAQHDAEQEAEMRTALGDEGFRQWDRERILREFDPSRMKFTAAEGDAIYDLRKSTDKQRMELEQSRLRGEVDEADYERQSEANNRKYEEQLRTVLGEDRYASLYSGGNGSGEIYRSLKAMEATDTQREAMIQAFDQWSQAREKLDRQMREGTISEQEFTAQMTALDATREQEYQRALGTNGFAEFQKAQDHRYRTMKRHAKNWGLSEDDINHLYSTIQSYEKNVQDFQQRAQAVEEQGEPVDWPAVQKSIEEYSKQTHATLEKLLGSDRYNKLKRNNVLVQGE